MAKISGSIIGGDFTNINAYVDVIKEIDYLHLDVMDGYFVPNHTFGNSYVSWLAKNKNLENVSFDVHLMVREVNESLVMRYIYRNTRIITTHIEATRYPVRLSSFLRDRDVLYGIAINPSSSVEMIEPILEYVDLVLIMSVEPGFAGQKFIEASYRKIEKINIIRERYGLDFLIEVDGGVNNSNAKRLIDLGVDILVMGSFLFGCRIDEAKSRIKKIYEDL